MTPGHEIAGIVEEVGFLVTKFKPGDRVGVGCMVDSCKSCESCLRGEEQFCLKGCVLTYNRVVDGEVTLPLSRLWPGAGVETFGSWIPSSLYLENSDMPGRLLYFSGRVVITRLKSLHSATSRSREDPLPGSLQ